MVVPVHTPCSTVWVFQLLYITANIWLQLVFNFIYNTLYLYSSKCVWNCFKYIWKLEDMHELKIENLCVVRDIQENIIFNSLIASNLHYHLLHKCTGLIFIKILWDQISVLLFSFYRRGTDAQSICDVHKTKVKLDSNTDVLRGHPKCFPFLSLTIHISGLKKNPMCQWCRQAWFYYLTYYG